MEFRLNDSGDDIGQVLAALPALVDRTPTLLRLGRPCTTRFLWEIGEREWSVDVQAGRVTRVAAGPFRMRGWSFALRGREAAWREFWSACPRVGFNDLFALARYGHARIEGDIGPLLANLRYLKALAALPGALLREAREP